MITRKELAFMIDHTLLKPDALSRDFDTLCQDAMNHGFRMVAINSYPVKYCKSLLGGSPVHVGAAIGFPLGQTTIETKLFEVKDAIANGADEIDYVINIGALKDGDLEYIEREMSCIVSECRGYGVLSKVIFENCYLSENEIREVSLIAKRVRPDFIKTSTGFGSYGARIEDVKIMKEVVGNACQIKAAGGIRDWATCKAMIDAGATRIGTSSGTKILNEFNEQANSTGSGN
ncbi:MAG: deoxyribose-phosphate aldolase [Erysipelotrichaceae bacterium]